MNYFGNGWLGRSRLLDQDGEMEVLRADIYQKGNMNYIELDLPGFVKEQIAIEYSNGYLTVTAIKDSTEEEETNYIRKERYYGEYSRTFYIGEARESLIHAKFENGILQISYQSEEESVTQRKIEIK